MTEAKVRGSACPSHIVGWGQPGLILISGCVGYRAVSPRPGSSPRAELSTCSFHVLCQLNFYNIRLCQHEFGFLAVALTPCDNPKSEKGACARDLCTEMHSSSSLLAPVLLPLAESSSHTFLESLEILVQVYLCDKVSTDLLQELYQEGTVETGTKDSSLIFMGLILGSCPPTRTLLIEICAGI